MTIPQGVSFITLGARDQPALRAFYEGLGWTPLIDAGDFVAFDLGGVLLGIYPVATLGEEAGAEPPAAGQWSGWTLAHNVATRDEVDARWQAWIDAGATPVLAPVDHPYGPRAGYVADPAGNRWEIAWADGIPASG